MRTKLLFLVFFFFLGGCVPTYALISPSTLGVSNGEVSVTTAIPWNKVPNVGGLEEAERWTLNGPSLDSVTFITGVKDGEKIAKQRKKEDRQIPPFSATMTPPEFVSMIETYFTILGAINYETTSVAPAEFLGGPGMQIDYQFTGADDVKRKGRTMLVVVTDKLYVMSALGAQLHYYDAFLPEFESMARSARIN